MGGIFIESGARIGFIANDEQIQKLLAEVQDLSVVSQNQSGT